MGSQKGLAGSLLVTAASILIAFGCGGGSSSSSSDSTSSSGSNQTTASQGSAPAGSTEPSIEFLGEGPNGKLAAVGKEASDVEREAASKVLEESFEAREAGDWAGQCATLASYLIEEIEKAVSVFGKPGCPKALESQAASAPASTRENTMIGPIDALRVKEGFNGFAHYHGTKGKDYIIPMIKQRGKWKLVALTTEEING